MDLNALRAVGECASKAGLEYIWLDSWCYRPEGEYSHAHFCETLATVVMHAHAVVWLPIARSGAAPSCGPRPDSTLQPLRAHDGHTHSCTDTVPILGCHSAHTSFVRSRPRRPVSLVVHIRGDGRARSRFARLSGRQPRAARTALARVVGVDAAGDTGSPPARRDSRFGLFQHVVPALVNGPPGGAAHVEDGLPGQGARFL
eukprot:1963103-Prymnesium_polylepis.1